MSQILHTKEIAEHIRTLIWDNLQGSLSLSSAALGDVQYYESISDLSSLLPGVFVKPVPGVSVEIRTLQPNYTMTYTFRIIHVMPFSVGDNVVEDKIDSINSISELIFNNTGLSGLSLSNAEVEICYPTNMEYEPIEEGIISLLNANYVAAAVVVRVKTNTSSG